MRCYDGLHESRCVEDFPSGLYCQSRILACVAGFRGLAGYPRYRAHVDSDCWQGSPGAKPTYQPLVGSAALRQPTWVSDIFDSVRPWDFRGRVRFSWGSPADSNKRRNWEIASAPAALCRSFL